MSTRWWLLLVLLFFGVSLGLWSIEDRVRPMSVTFLTHQLDELKKRNASLRSELHRLKERVYLLEHNPYGLEKVARERHWLLKEGEVIVILDE